MCAIAGIANLKSEHVDASLLRKMNDRLRHRGTDDEGYIFIQPNQLSCVEYSGGDSPKRVRDCYPLLRDLPYPFSFGLAHRRFSIVDLSTEAHQPFFDTGRICCVVSNGEIFNYLELRDELVKRGHHFRSASDTEVIVEAYKAWGVECFARFNGMWALALYDFTNKRLVVCRDRLGEIPLYWRRIGNVIYFASEIKALLDLAPVPPVNEDTIYPYLVHGLQARNTETFFADIHSFPAAAWALVDDNFPATVRNYWKPPERRFKEYELSVSKAASWVKDTLRDAVRIRLRADAPWCLTLSGGLDSSVLAGLATECSGGSVVAHTVRFPDKEWDEEEPFARLVAQCHGAEQYVVEPPMGNLWHEILPFTYLQEEPYHAPNIYTRHLLQRAMAAQGFKVVLVGEGADELFGGYRRHFQLLQTENLLAHRFVRFVDNELHWSESSSPVRHKIESVLRHIYLSSPDDILTNDENWGAECINLPAVLRERGRVPRTLSDALYDEITNTSIPYWVRTNDRARMGIPMEGRSPFLDYRVVELALTLPVTYLIRHGWHKWILRKAFRKSLPQEVVWRKHKLGFPYPFKRFIFDSPPAIRTLFQELQNPYVDLPSFQRFANDPANIQRDEWEAQIACWRMISFLLWYELFVNRNENLFSKIKQEYRVNYVEDSFVPKFLYSCTAPGLH